VSDSIHVSIDDILSGWKSACTHKDMDGDCIDECSVGRIARWGAHYIAIIHDDVPEDEREEVAKFIAEAPEKIANLEQLLIKVKETLTAYSNNDVHGMGADECIEEIEEYFKLK